MRTLPRTPGHKGTKVRLGFVYTTPDVRREFLTALAPFVCAPGVLRGGPVVDALEGTLW